MVLFERKEAIVDIDFSLVAVQRLIDILMNKLPQLNSSRLPPDQNGSSYMPYFVFILVSNKANNKLMRISVHLIVMSKLNLCAATKLLFGTVL